MYFNNKSYFDQERNMRVIAEQPKPKKRKKGVKKKKGKNDKVDMRKIKSLFGQDVIVKLLLALVDKKNEGPKLKNERNRSTKMKVKKTSGRGSGLATPAQVKKERQQEEKKRRVEQATKKKAGETDIDVLQRLIQEVAVGNDPASLEYLKRNTIAPELRRSLGNISTLAEAYFSDSITQQQKKKLERQIVKQVIKGVGGEIRTNFLTASEDEEVLKGIKDSIEALKKLGYTNPEKIIANKSKIEEKLQNDLDKAEKSEDVNDLELALEGLEVVEVVKTTNTDEIEETITQEQVETVKQKAGRKKITPEKIRSARIEYMENLNPALQIEGENRTIFVNKIDELLSQGKQKQAIERILGTMNKKLLKGNPVQQSTETIAPKNTRGDAGIFVKGAIADSEDTKYNIEVPEQGIVLFDLFDVNKRAKYVNEQIKKYEQGLESDITSSKQKNSLVKELKSHKLIFRNQLTQINEGKDTKAPTEYDTLKNFPQDLSGEKLRNFLKERGFGFPVEQIYKGEKIVAVGQGGFTVKSPEGFLRYIDYDQTKFKKELAKQAKEAEKEQKLKEKLGFELSTAPESETESTGTFTTKIEKLLAEEPEVLQQQFLKGGLSEFQIRQLAPILQKAYPRQKKKVEKENKRKKKTEEKKEEPKAFDTIDETVYYSKITGRKITQEELDKNDYLYDEIFDDSGNKITEAQAKQIEITRKPKKVSELTQQEREDLTFQDEFGNVIEPFDVVVDTAKSKAESKATKKASQEKFIKEYKEGNKAVINRILLPGKKELAEDGWYELTEKELENMSLAERKKYTTIEKEPEVEQSRNKIEQTLDEREVISDSEYKNIYSNKSSSEDYYPTGGTAGSDRGSTDTELTYSGSSGTDEEGEKEKLLQNYSVEE